MTHIFFNFLFTERFLYTANTRLAYNVSDDDVHLLTPYYNVMRKRYSGQRREKVENEVKEERKDD